jgi:hypothetical protein
MAVSQEYADAVKEIEDLKFQLREAIEKYGRLHEKIDSKLSVDQVIEDREGQMFRRMIKKIHHTENGVVIIITK